MLNQEEMMQKQQEQNGNEIPTEKDTVSPVLKDTVAFFCADCKKAYGDLLEFAGIRPGMKVFCPDFLSETFAEQIAEKGGIPVFIDAEYETWNMDPKALECAFDRYENTGIAVVTYLNGVPARMEELLEVVEKHQAVLIEDLTYGFGTTYRGKALGSFGSFAIKPFSLSEETGALVFAREKPEALPKDRYAKVQDPFDMWEGLFYGCEENRAEHAQKRRAGYFSGCMRIEELLKEEAVWFQKNSNLPDLTDGEAVGFLTEEGLDPKMRKQLEEQFGSELRLPMPLHMRERFLLHDFVVNSNGFRCHCGPGVFVGKDECYVEVSGELYRRAVIIPLTRKRSV